MVDNIYPSTQRFLIALTMMIGAGRVALYMYGSAVLQSFRGLDLNDKFQLIQVHEYIG